MNVLFRPAHFRDVDQALHAWLKFDEGAIVGDVGDRALKPRAYRVLGGDALPRVGFELLDARLMRWVSGLMRMICTLTLSPTFTISLGWATRRHAMSVTCRSPSMPPKSMNAP